MSSIEWLIEQVNSDCLNSVFIRKELVDQAKAMHREEIIKAHGTRYYNVQEVTGEDYYNENFNSNPKSK